MTLKKYLEKLIGREISYIYNHNCGMVTFNLDLTIGGSDKCVITHVKDDFIVIKFLRRVKGYDKVETEVIPLANISHIKIPPWLDAGL